MSVLKDLVDTEWADHPAVWWISRQVRAERENCCDDAVVALTGDIRGYAAALTTLEEKRWSAVEAALAATGGNLKAPASIVCWAARSREWRPDQ